MDEKYNEALKGINNELTEEQKSKAKECKTMDELKALEDGKGKGVSDDVLDSVAGGMITPMCNDEY